MIMEALGEMKKYKANVINIEALMEKKYDEFKSISDEESMHKFLQSFKKDDEITEMTVKALIKGVKSISDVESMLKFLQIPNLSLTTYGNIKKDGVATEKAIEALIEFLKCDEKNLILEEITDVTESEKRKKQHSKLSKNIKNTDQSIVDEISELLKQITTTDPIEYFEDVNYIGYKKIKEGKYKIAVSMDEGWLRENYVIEVNEQEGSEQWKEQMLTKIDLKLHGTLDTIEDKLDQNKKEENKKLIAKYEKLIASVWKRPLKEVDQDLCPPKVKRVVIKSLQELLENIDEIKQRTIEYTCLENEEYLVTLPFDKEDCEKLGGDEYPLQLTCSLEHVENSTDFENDLFDSIIDQFCSEYFESGDKEIKIVEEKLQDLYSFQLKECDPDVDELTEEETKNICKAYQMLLYFMEKQGKVSQSEKNKLVKDIDYAEQKFKEFGIPSPFEKIK